MMTLLLIALIVCGMGLGNRLWGGKGKGPPPPVERFDAFDDRGTGFGG